MKDFTGAEIGPNGEREDVVITDFPGSRDLLDRIRRHHELGMPDEDIKAVIQRFVDATGATEEDLRQMIAESDMGPVVADEVVAEDAPAEVAPEEDVVEEIPIGDPAVEVPDVEVPVEAAPVVEETPAEPVVEALAEVPAEVAPEVVTEG